MMNRLKTEGQDYDLLMLHKQSEVNNMSQFCGCIKRLDVDKLVAAYEKLRVNAPRRHTRGKKYFVCHSRTYNTEGNSNRREEHLAIALCKGFNRRGAVNHAEISKLRMLDYQFPLQARQTDIGVGKVDLFAAIDDVYPCVIELKIDSNKSRGDSPLGAFLQGLAYCAIVDANIEDISREAKKKFRLNCNEHQLRLLVMAPQSYWEKYKQHKKAGDWQPALQKLADMITKRIGLKIHFAALRNAEFSMGDRTSNPTLTGKCIVESVLLR